MKPERMQKGSVFFVLHFFRQLHGIFEMIQLLHHLFSRIALFCKRLDELPSLAFCCTNTVSAITIQGRLLHRELQICQQPCLRRLKRRACAYQLPGLAIFCNSSPASVRQERVQKCFGVCPGSTVEDDDCLIDIKVQNEMWGFLRHRRRTYQLEKFFRLNLSVAVYVRFDDHVIDCVFCQVWVVETCNCPQNFISIKRSGAIGVKCFEEMHDFRVYRIIRRYLRCINPINECLVGAFTSSDLYIVKK
mmetsp:Transcript_50763/g.91148  ORF Transcript_50763/g.91148 Transcript_50763/m.91148 type:complete len:247 (-) Transcript_50763:158-898(-)